MLATGRSVSLVSALVALTLFVIMEPSVVSSYSAYINAVMEKYHARQREIATKYADKGTTTTRPISRFDLLAEMDTNNASSPANIDATRLYEEESGSSPTQAHRQIRDTPRVRVIYDDYFDNPYIDNDNNTLVTLQNKITKGDCHTGTLSFEQYLSLYVRSSFSTEVNIPVSVDESYCISCISVKARNSFESNYSCSFTSRNNMKVTVRSSSYEYSQRFELDVKVYQVRKRSRFCD